MRKSVEGSVPAEMGIMETELRKRYDFMKNLERQPVSKKTHDSLKKG